MAYFLCKATRLFNGQPYCGPTSDYIPAVFDSLEEAMKAKRLFQERNPVGWNIFTDTGELVDGYDFSQDLVKQIDAENISCFRDENVTKAKPT